MVFVNPSGSLSPPSLAFLIIKPGIIIKNRTPFSDAEVFRKVISECDFVMMDLKLADREEHKKFTGVYNDKILANLEILKSSGKEFLLRTPLIPGITDTDENLTGIARLANGSPVELLPYNNLAPAKYPSVGREYTGLIAESESRIKSADGLPRNFQIR